MAHPFQKPYTGNNPAVQTANAINHGADGFHSVSTRNLRLLRDNGEQSDTAGNIGSVPGSGSAVVVCLRQSQWGEGEGTGWRGRKLGRPGRIGH